jgi:TetR/AcrR family transcriptional repressor of nem operon
MEMFWSKGYEATSLSDLLKAMEISKSSFYQAFGSKHELFERCLARFRERQVTRMRAALAGAETAKRFIRSMLTAIVADAARMETPKGCLIMNTATEFSGRDASVARLVSHATSDFADVFATAVRQAQREGDIAPEKDADALARYIVSTISGLKTMVKAGYSPKAVDEVVEVAMGAL